MHRQSKRAGRRGRFAVGLALAAAMAASLSIGVPAASATCTAAATTIVLTPSTQTHATGQTATVTATVKCSGAPLTNRFVFFKVNTGPNAGKSMTVKTNAAGVAVFSYTSSKTGTDKVAGKIDQLKYTCCVDVIWTAPKPPLRYTGYAHNASLKVVVPILGTTTLAPVNPTGPVDTTSSTNVTNQVLDVDGAVLDADILRTNVTTGSGQSTAFAEAAGATVATLGVLPAIANVDVRSDSKATCAALTGTTTITSLKVGATVLVGPGGILGSAPLVPSVNQTINLGVVKVVLNEQILSAGKIQVNAVHVTVPTLLGGSPLETGADVILSHAESDIHNC